MRRRQFPAKKKTARGRNRPPRGVEPSSRSPSSPPTSSSTGPSTPMGVAVQLVERVGRALHAYGSSAHRLEGALDRVSRRLGIRGQFFSTPTGIMASFLPADSSDETVPRTVLLRVEPGEIDLEKLSDLDHELGQLMRGEREPRETIRRVDAIVARPPRYGRLAIFVAFALASGGAARFFGGGPREWLAAAVIGLVTGCLAWALEQLENAGRLYETVAALVAAFGATAAAVHLGPLSHRVVIVAALIVLVPGMTLTLAMTELATRNLVSGAARLAGALLMFVTIGVGFAVGSRLGTTAFGAPIAFDPGPQPWWTEAVALVITAGALLVLFRGHPRDYGWFLMASTVSIVGSRAGAYLLGPELGAVIGAILVGVSSNLVSRLRDRPVALVQLPGLMLLVPGSLGFRSVTALVAADTLSGVQTAFTVVLVAISLVTGLLVANVLVPPRRIL